jgi:hypothetical protein
MPLNPLKGTSAHVTKASYECLKGNIFITAGRRPAEKRPHNTLLPERQDYPAKQWGEIKSPAFQDKRFIYLTKKHKQYINIRVIRKSSNLILE